MLKLLRTTCKFALPGWLRAGLLVLATLVAPALHAADSADQKAPLQLAERIAHASNTDDRNTNLALMADYESVYGSIENVPARWPALVRRALVCQQLANRVCMRSSLEALQKEPGGMDGLPFTHLFEVSRFGLSVQAMKARLHDVAAESTKAPLSEKRDAAPVASAKVSPATTERKPVLSEDISESNPPVAPPKVAVIDGAKPAAVETAKPAPAHPAAKLPAPARTLSQRATAKLSKLGLEDQAGYFLDALFVAVVVCLVLLFMLYSSGRSRKAERAMRLQAMQEIQRLEEARDEEKIRTDHELWSEQLKSEVALEAQKTHAAEVLKMVQAAADEALQAEMQRFMMDQEANEAAFNVEKRRLIEALRFEQSKTDDLVKAAKARADQAIDAYDQMAARELVYAHKQNDELQEELSAEKRAREALESKFGDAMQQVENYKQRELRLHEAINIEQRGRASEARMGVEKLKAAQQAAASLQASLAAMRALNADLERRAAESARAAEARIDEALRHTGNPAQQSAN